MTNLEEGALEGLKRREERVENKDQESGEVLERSQRSFLFKWLYESRGSASKSVHVPTQLISGVQ